MKRKMLLMIAVLFLSAMPFSIAHAENKGWVCGSSSWSIDGCWEGINYAPGQPVNGDSVYLHPDPINGGYTVTYDTNSYISLGTIMVGTGLGTVTLEITAPYASIDINDFYVGAKRDVSPMGSGAVVQSGGTVGSFDLAIYDPNNDDTANTNLTLGVITGDSGSYTLTGGSLYAESEIIGDYGSGVFTQDGATGSNNTTNYAHDLYLGNEATGNGVYNLGAGELTSDALFIGYDGTGEFTQSSPLNSHNTTNSLFLGVSRTGSGAYTMMGGWLTAGSEYIGFNGTGAFTQWGGLNSIAGDLNIGGTPGHAGTGAYSMTGALGGNPTLTVANDIFVGRNGNGTFTQDGGSITAANEYIGYGNGSTGAFTQYNGSNTVSGALYIGYDAGAGTYTQEDGFSVTYTQDGGSITATNEYIGYSGTGAFTQTNGSNTVSNALYLGSGAGSSGTYNLSGAWTSSLQAGAEVVGHDGNGIFNQSGGWNIVSTNLHVGSGSGTGEYNLSGGNLSASNENIGTGTGLGIFNQTGGYNQVSGTLTIGTNGEYNLDNASDAGYYIFLDTETIVNNGVINYSGGYVSLSARGDFCSYCGDDPNATTFENNGTLNISGEPAKTIDGNITNNGTVNAVNTNIRFNGTFTNNGEYFSDPSSSFFNDLIINETGYLVGGTGDNFFLSGDFMNYSTQTEFWNTMDSYLGFTGSNPHEFYLAVSDTVSIMSFSWDTLELSDGGSLLFSGGAGASLYVDNLILSAGSTLNLSGFNLYYYSLTDLGGSYSGGELIMLASNDGGSSQVPEPSTILLLVGGIAGLAGFRRYYR